LTFWYFCLIWAYKASLALYAQIKQKYQNGNIHRKLTVLTSVILCWSYVQYFNSTKFSTAVTRKTHTFTVQRSCTAVLPVFIAVGLIPVTTCRLVRYSKLQVHPSNFYVWKWHQVTDPALTQLHSLTWT
jgi:hypothetical protein